jgi:hypothetical protein
MTVNTDGGSERMEKELSMLAFTTMMLRHSQQEMQNDEVDGHPDQAHLQKARIKGEMMRAVCVSLLVLKRNCFLVELSGKGAGSAIAVPLQNVIEMAMQAWEGRDEF